MAEIINLRQARKAKTRARAGDAAAANRAKHGRTKAERAREEADAARREKLLDQAKRED
ncbi:MAG: DUF4169 family protein [Sphingomonadaceae bacterium]|nr:DUF4169 family protein [Sphingomonadaceae bacterium]